MRIARTRTRQYRSAKGLKVMMDGLFSQKNPIPALSSFSVSPAILRID
jgi:hypothetical protein